jgi:uncharacterized protein (TIGR02246 family)
MLSPMSRPLHLFTGLLVAALTMTSVEPAAGQATNDATAIRAVVARYVAARERRDADALRALFTEDADQLVSSGEWRRGRDAVVRGGLESSARSPGARTIKIETVRVVASDVAIADGRYDIAATASAEARRMWTTFVLRRTTGGWLISAIRNMRPTP